MPGEDTQQSRGLAAFAAKGVAGGKNDKAAWRAGKHAAPQQKRLKQHQPQREARSVATAMVPGERPQLADERANKRQKLVAGPPGAAASLMSKSTISQQAAAAPRQARANKEAGAVGDRCAAAPRQAASVAVLAAAAATTASVGRGVGADEAATGSAVAGISASRSMSVGGTAAAGPSKTKHATMPNTNWEAMKQAIAATKRPLPADGVERWRHRQKKLRADSGSGGTDGTAAAGCGKRPGAIGAERGVTQVLAVDCEMVGTGPNGSVSVLARVCLVNSAGQVLLDTFVQPKDKVTDYRTWVSGVRRSDLANGRPFDGVIQEVGDLVRGRVLVGHAIMNDLRALLLEEHPKHLLRDTAKYPPLMKTLPSGKRVSASLRELAAQHLGLAIQQGEHTPVDDARAALYLYQKHHKEWDAAAASGRLTGTHQLTSVKGSASGGKRGRHSAMQGGIRGGGSRAARTAAAAPSGLGPPAVWQLHTDIYADM